MSSIVRPGDPLYSDLENARLRDKGELVELAGLFYRIVEDGDVLFYCVVEKKPEKTSTGKPDRYHRAPYPPEVN